MKVLIVGGGRVGIAVHERLRGSGHSVTIVEPDPGRCATIRDRHPGADVVCGSGTDPVDLEASGIHGTDAVAALSGRDEVNLVACALARFEYDVPRTIARIVDPAHRWLHTPAMGVDVALDQAELLTSLVAEELSLDQMTTLMKLRRGQLELIEQHVHPTALAAGKAVRDLGLSPRTVLIAVLRADGPVIPHGDLVLRAGDEVMAITTTGRAAELAAVIGPRPAEGPTTP